MTLNGKFAGSLPTLQLQQGIQHKFRHLVSQGCIEAFCNLLACPDPKIVMVRLLGLDDILKAGEMEKGLDKCGLNQYAQLVDECEGLEKIEHLRLHDNNEIYAKAVRMLEKYWVGEEDETQDAQGAIKCAFDSALCILCFTRMHRMHRGLEYIIES